MVVRWTGCVSKMSMIWKDSLHDSKRDNVGFCLHTWWNIHFR